MVQLLFLNSGKALSEKDLQDIGTVPRTSETPVGNASAARIASVSLFLALNAYPVGTDTLCASL